MSTQSPSQKAAAYFQSGYNCAQSVLLALTEHINPDSKNDMVPRIAAGFGGGIGRCGSVCGALIGGVMAIGIEYGSNDSDPKKRLKANAKTQLLYKQFEHQHGSVMCRELKQPNQSADKACDRSCPALIKSVVEAYLALEKP